MARTANRKPRGVKATGASLVDKSKYEYGKVRVRDKSGKLRHSANNGDAVARAMTGLTLDEVLKAAKRNGIEFKGTGGNAGTQRMSIGQSLRAKVRRGEEVTIGKHVIKSLTQRVALPESVEPAPRKRG